jgi:hypothetical protein
LNAKTTIKLPPWGGTVSRMNITKRSAARPWKNSF